MIAAAIGVGMGVDHASLARGARIARDFDRGDLDLDARSRAIAAANVKRERRRAKRARAMNP